MQFEIHTDYAIRSLRLLYTRGDEILTAMQIAIAIGTTSPTFSKIANKLRSSGLLKTIQGGQGGYVLGKPANEISIYDVLLSIEGELRINLCIENGERCEHGEEVKCKVHDIMYGIQEELIEKLSNVFIADLV
jgi:Rrf2 family protein